MNSFTKAFSSTAPVFLALVLMVSIFLSACAQENTAGSATEKSPSDPSRSMFSQARDYLKNLFSESEDVDSYTFTLTSCVLVVDSTNDAQTLSACDATVAWDAQSLEATVAMKIGTHTYRQASGSQTVSVGLTSIPVVLFKSCTLTSDADDGVGGCTTVESKALQATCPEGYVVGQGLCVKEVEENPSTPPSNNRSYVFEAQNCTLAIDQTNQSRTLTFCTQEVTWDGQNLLDAVAVTSGTSFLPQESGVQSVDLTLIPFAVRLFEDCSSLGSFIDYSSCSVVQEMSLVALCPEGYLQASTQDAFCTLESDASPQNPPDAQPTGSPEYSLTLTHCELPIFNSNMSETAQTCTGEISWQTANVPYEIRIYTREYTGVADAQGSPFGPEVLTFTDVNGSWPVDWVTLTPLQVILKGNCTGDVCTDVLDQQQFSAICPDYYDPDYATGRCVISDGGSGHAGTTSLIFDVEGCELPVLASDPTRTDAQCEGRIYWEAPNAQSIVSVLATQGNLVQLHASGWSDTTHPPWVTLYPVMMSLHELCANYQDATGCSDPLIAPKELVATCPSGFSPDWDVGYCRRN